MLTAAVQSARWSAVGWSPNPAPGSFLAMMLKAVLFSIASTAAAGLLAGCPDESGPMEKAADQAEEAAKKAEEAAERAAEEAEEAAEMVEEQADEAREKAAEAAEEAGETAEEAAEEAEKAAEEASP